jgi:hypothetical protein
MTKDELLKELVDEYRNKIRRPDDITLSDFRKAFFKATGQKIGEKKGLRILTDRVENGEYESLIVIDTNGRDVRIWRKVTPKKRGK